MRNLNVSSAPLEPGLYLGKTFKCDSRSHLALPLGPMRLDPDGYSSTK